MTREEFNNASFGAGDTVMYQGFEFDVVSVSFSEGLFGIDMDDDADNLTWARCESVEFIGWSK